MRERAREFLRSLLGLVWPEGCAACGRACGGVLCAECLERGRCGGSGIPAPLEGSGLEVVSWGRAGGPWRAVAHGFKYHGEFRWPELVAEALSEESPFGPLDAERTVWIPVPLHRAKRRLRGYNQAELLARAFAKRWGGRVETGWLKRVRSSVSQTRLGAAERRANVASGFAYGAGRPFPEALEPILVDDVLTTGATLESCARALEAGGARVSRAMTLLRAELAGDDFEAERDAAEDGESA
ncbi:MAG: ComF family protein [Fibrobacterales bacterium]|nr:ComF family protein [Fibrobacterales bacterium]